MSGPYFKGQMVAPCGCYYPDVTRVGTDLNPRESILYCTTHGEYRVPASSNTVTRSERMPIPTEEWRKEERRRMRSEVEVEEELKATCKECGFSAHPDDFDVSSSAYHDLKCPRCGTTNIDWTCGSYVDNTLQTGRSSR